MGRGSPRATLLHANDSNRTPLCVRSIPRTSPWIECTLMSGALPETVLTAAPATPLPAPANVLTYDNLPPHSTLLREVLVDRTGETCVKITAPATEAAPATRLAI